jgi:hypothetical protein
MINTNNVIEIKFENFDQIILDNRLVSDSKTQQKI